RLAKPFVLLLEILQLPKLVTAHAAILLAPPVERQFGNADLANGIRHRHALAAQNLNLPKLRDDLVGLVSLVCHCGPPSWSKPYFKVDPSVGADHLHRLCLGLRILPQIKRAQHIRKARVEAPAVDEDLLPRHSGYVD